MNIDMPVSSVELQEYLFAEALKECAKECESSEDMQRHSKLIKNIRESFRLQRFAVINWLLMNGVSIPPELLSDEAHPTVGNQYPDKK